MNIGTVYGSLPEDLEDEVRHLRRELAAIHRAHQEAARPYFDRLVQIESLRPVRHVFIQQPAQSDPTCLAG